MATTKDPKGPVTRSRTPNDSDVKDLMKNIFNKGILPKEAMGLSDEMVEGIYGHSYRLYNAGQYREALQLFRLLIMLNALEPKYILGYAACYHMLGQYDNALIAYAVVAVLSPKDPMPPYHSFDCYTKLGIEDKALESLKEAYKKCGNQPQFAPLKERIQLILKNLKKDPEAITKQERTTEAKKKK